MNSREKHKHLLQGLNRNVVFKRNEMEAYCSSIVCHKDQWKTPGKLKTNIKYPQDECTDCGHVIFWRRIGDEVKEV